MSTRQRLPRRHPVVESAPFDDEFVLFDPRVDRVHHVRQIAAVVWHGCDDNTDIEELVADMHDVLGGDVADLRAEVARVTDLLAAEGLLEGTEPPPGPPPCLGCTDGTHDHGGRASVLPRRRSRRGRLRRK